MEKIVAVGTAMIIMLLLLPSCAGMVSQEEYDQLSGDLAAAQAQVQSLHDELTQANTQIGTLQQEMGTVNEKRAEALAYAELMDILLYPAWMQAGISPRFFYEDEVEWFEALKNKAADLEDEKASGYIRNIENGSAAATGLLLDYCMDRIEKASQ
jgi:cell division protein FtsB